MPIIQLQEYEQPLTLGTDRKVFRRTSLQKIIEGPPGYRTIETPNNAFSAMIFTVLVEHVSKILPSYDMQLVHLADEKSTPAILHATKLSKTKPFEFNASIGGINFQKG